MKIGVADTTFARVDLFKEVEPLFKKAHLKVERYTVPGIKDLPVACKILFEKHDCDIVMALGMPGGMPIDKQCAHEASLGIQFVQILSGKHILEVFAHLDEGKPSEVVAIAKNRVRKHALNALALLKGKEALSPFAGKGRRQGKDDEGALE